MGFGHAGLGSAQARIGAGATFQGYQTYRVRGFDATVSRNYFPLVRAGRAGRVGVHRADRGFTWALALYKRVRQGGLERMAKSAP